MLEVLILLTASRALRIPKSLIAPEYDRDFFVVGTSGFCQTFDSVFVFVVHSVIVLFVSQI